MVKIRKASLEESVTEEERISKLMNITKEMADKKQKTVYSPSYGFLKVEGGLEIDFLRRIITVDSPKELNLAVELARKYEMTFRHKRKDQEFTVQKNY